MILPEVKRVVQKWNLVGTKAEEENARSRTRPGSRLGVTRPDHLSPSAVSPASSEAGTARPRSTSPAGPLSPTSEITAELGPTAASTSSHHLGALPAPSKLVCIGRSYAYNYGSAADVPARAELPPPLLFIKPPTAVARDGDVVRLPPHPHKPGRTCAGWYEVELCVVIGAEARDVRVRDAMQYVAGYALGLELAAQELRLEAMEKRLPWEAAKARDGFAPLSGLIPSEDVPDLRDVQLELEVNGQRAIRGTTSTMVYSVAELVAYASSVVTLHPGDVIMTGCPPHPGAFQPGDTLSATMRTRGRAPRAEAAAESASDSASTPASAPASAPAPAAAADAAIPSPPAPPDEWREVARVSVTVEAAPEPAELAEGAGEDASPLWLRRIA